MYVNVLAGSKQRTSKITWNITLSGVSYMMWGDEEMFDIIIVLNLF